MTTNTCTFWFHVYSDYRSGTNVYVYTKPPTVYHDDNTKDDTKDEVEDDDMSSSAPEEAYEITMEIPKTSDYRLYVVNEFPTYRPVWYRDVKDEDEAHELYLKIFSQFHDCMPFQVTGYTSSYKEEGYYPEVPETIKEIPDIEELNPIIGDDDDDGYYFIVVIDSDGKEIFTKPLRPIF